MLEELKRQVHEANLKLVAEGLVTQTFGNASAIDRISDIVVIKPSGVPYEEMTPERMVLVLLKTGQVVEGKLNPSSDTPTHLVLYRRLKSLGGIAHTHSLFATAWAQARLDIPALGTTHADYFHGPVPCTRLLTTEEIQSDYESNTGNVIAERFAKLDPLAVPAVLVAGHGPFTWGQTVAQAVESAIALECVARLASETVRVNPGIKPMPRPLLDKHFLRKHGPDAYYGQK